MGKREYSEKEIKRNQAIQDWYPVGIVDSIWTLLEYLMERTDRQGELVQLCRIEDALAKYDNMYRKRVIHPLMKKLNHD